MVKYKEGQEIEVNGTVFTLIRRVGHSKYWYVECSICSKDVEIYPPLSMKATLGNLKKGVMPCMCSNSPRMNERQNTIRVLRECEKRDYKFMGWVGGKYKGMNKTGISLYDYLHETLVTVKSISSFLSGKDGMSRASDNIRKGKILYTDEEYSALFLSTGRFPEGTTFTRDNNYISNQNRYNGWFVECPVCKEDQFSKEGLCSGVFKSSYPSLSKGHCPCRCADRYQYTDEQQAMRIKTMLESEGYSFTGIEDKRVHWVCSCSTVNDTSVPNILRGRRCKAIPCKTKNIPLSNYGYYSQKSEEEDILYLIEFTRGGELFYKIGRSFDLDSRFSTLSKVGYETVLLSTYKSHHKTIYNLEQHLHKVSKEFHYTPQISFAGSIRECFTVDVLSNEEVIKTFKLK